MAARGARACCARETRNGQRGNTAGGDSGYAGGAGDHFVCGAADDGRVSEDCERDWSGFAFRGAVAAAGYDSVRRSVVGEGAGVVDRAAAVAGFGGAAFPMRRVDLNCDMGELPEMLADGSQEALMKLVTSANVACGGRGGGGNSMRGRDDAG